MKKYVIKVLQKIPEDFSDIEKAEISAYRWGKDYTPRATAQLVMVKDLGFVLRMVCEESSPLSRFENYGDPVYKDSCLEFFACYDDLSDDYVNIEMNANGALLSAKGEGRHNRIPVKDICGEIFEISAKKRDREWETVAKIPFSMLEKLYGMDTQKFKSGYVFSGNFYKCGDETSTVHYGAWSEVGTENPDFHRPEFFGKLIIE